MDDYLQSEPFPMPHRRQRALPNLLEGIRALEYCVGQLEKHSRAVGWYAREVLIRERELASAADVESAQTAMTGAWDANRVVAVSMCEAARQAANVWEYNDVTHAWTPAVNAVADAARWARIAQEAIERMEERNADEWDDMLALG